MIRIELQIDLTYLHEPGDPKDGLTVAVPISFSTCTQHTPPARPSPANA